MSDPDRFHKGNTLQVRWRNICNLNIFTTLCYNGSNFISNKYGIGIFPMKIGYVYEIGILNRGLLVPFRETDVGDEAPPFNRPSGSGRWYNLSAVCNEAAAKTKGASP